MGKCLLCCESIPVCAKNSTMKPTDTKHTLSAEAPADPSLIASGVMGIPTAASHHRLATVSTHELVQKSRQKELDRIVHSGRDPSADYASYVLLPLFLLVGVLIGLRRLLAL